MTGFRGVLGRSPAPVRAAVNCDTSQVGLRSAPVVTIACAEKAGDTLFDTTASGFAKLTETAASTKASDQLYEPFALTLKIEYYTNKNEVVLIGGAFNPRPPSEHKRTEPWARPWQHGREERVRARHRALRRRAA